MTDLALVRADIKSWERDFVSRHGRDPSVQDIRDNPPIAEKYKLYKKLSKAAAQTTPPRLPVPKSRPANSVAPLPGFNPFSPVKKTAKHNDKSASHASHPNPFATPAKNKPKPNPRTTTPSPDPFPPISSQQADANPSYHPTSTTAVSRARKRLRGEPVSPSPNKPKRQRVRSQALPSIHKLEHDSSNSEHEADHELPQCGFNSSFVADSPVKAPAGGKSFKLLFDDALPTLPLPKKPLGSSAAELDSPPDAAISHSASAGTSVSTFLKPYHDLKLKGVISGREHRVNRTLGKISPQIFPAKDHPPVPSHKSTFKPAASEISQPRTSTKRALDSNDLVCGHTEPSIPSQSRYPLVPPSPPPQASISRDTGKGKAKTTTSRKKLRAKDQESDDGVDSPDDIMLKVATVSLDRGKHLHRHADDLDWDPLLHLRTRNHDSAAKEHMDANHHASGTFSVDLPDKLRRVLAISPSRSHNGTEERVVRGLLHGDRVGHYDPSRGGDIWDAGETDEGVLGDAETEDDWEGEPVPWEVGEL